MPKGRFNKTGNQHAQAGGRDEQPTETTNESPLSPMEIGFVILISLSLLAVGNIRPRNVVSSILYQDKPNSTNYHHDDQPWITTNHPISIDDATTTHWCVVDHGKLPHKPSWFAHFPHCMEIVLPCWSWFRSKQATNNCGFVLVGDNIRFDHNDNNNTWQNQLVTSHMNCQVRRVATSSNLATDDKDGGVYHFPNVKFMRPRPGKFNYLREVEDAQALRRAVGVSDEWVSTQKGEGKPLQVGLLQRGNKRIVLNMNDIEEGLRIAMPDANITQTSFDIPPTLQEQAKWFASKDVIISPHGAGLVNSVFITRGTLVLQLFPPGFYWQFYDFLIEQSGGLALAWTKDTELSANLNRKHIYQHANFEVPVYEVLEIILEALEKELPSADLIKQSG